MKIHLVNISEKPLFKMSLAAKICRSDKNILDLMVNEGLDSNIAVKIAEVEKYVSKIIEMGHESIMEHVNITWIFEDVTRALTHQLVRHRLCSYSQQSLRAVEITEDKFNKSDSFYKFEPNSMKIIRDCLEEYLNMIDNGVPVEEARLILPIGTPTNIMVTTNLRNLRHMCMDRICIRAQSEIQTAFSILRDLITKKNEFIGNLLGSKCELGLECTDHCPDGRNKK